MQMFWGKLASVGQEVDIFFARRFPLPTGFLFFFASFRLIAHGGYNLPNWLAGGLILDRKQWAATKQRLWQS